MSSLKVPVSEADHVAYDGEADGPGEAGAVCTLVEYGDYQCPHCAMAHPAVKRLQRHFGGRLRFVFRNFPLTKIHANAQVAAECAEYAGSQGKFWEMHDLLFEKQDEWADADAAYDLFAEYAADIQIDPKELQESLNKGRYADRVRADFIGGVRSGVNGTPTFFIHGDRHNGPNDYDHLARAIDASLEV